MASCVLLASVTYHWIYLLIAGVCCGFLNAAASSGSAITLPVLLALGLPPSLANGTNRLPVLVGMATAFWSFQRRRAIPWSFVLRLLPAFLLSALLGAGLASALPMGQIRLLVHVAVALALLLLLFKPQRWLRDGADLTDSIFPSARLQVAMAGVGLWTGLIVLDAGTYLMISLVLIGGLSLKQANAVKVVLVGGATLISLAVFIVGGEIDWPSAFPLMLGSAVGGRFGAAVALGPSARQWIYRLLILALLLELASMVWMWISPSTQPFMM
jgi:uncharacterized membrane protein YfcA